MRRVPWCILSHLDHFINVTCIYNELLLEYQKIKFAYTCILGGRLSGIFTRVQDHVAMLCTKNMRSHTRTRFHEMSVIDGFCTDCLYYHLNTYRCTSFLRNASMALEQSHYSDVIMTTMASQITSLTIVYSTVYSCANQRKHQSSASLAFVRGIHRGLGTSPHKEPVTRKMFPFDDVIMFNIIDPVPVMLTTMGDISKIAVILPSWIWVKYRPNHNITRTLQIIIGIHLSSKWHHIAGLCEEYNSFIRCDDRSIGVSAKAFQWSGILKLLAVTARW